jgi:uncharacterized protein
VPVKAVLDTNIWISALITAGIPKKLVEVWLTEESFIVVYPQWLLDELRKVPSKPRLAARIRQEDLQNLIILIEEDGFLVEPEEVSSVSRDPKDDVFLSCAQASGADFLVTGDNDLLCLTCHHETLIVTPRQFLGSLKS